MGWNWSWPIKKEGYPAGGWCGLLSEVGPTTRTPRSRARTQNNPDDDDSVCGLQFLFFFGSRTAKRRRSRPECVRAESWRWWRWWEMMPLGWLETTDNTHTHKQFSNFEVTTMWHAASSKPSCCCAAACSNMQSIYNLYLINVVASTASQCGGESRTHIICLVYIVALIFSSQIDCSAGSAAAASSCHSWSLKHYLCVLCGNTWHRIHTSSKHLV